MDLWSQQTKFIIYPIEKAMMASGDASDHEEGLTITFLGVQ